MVLQYLDVGIVWSNWVGQAGNASESSFPGNEFPIGQLGPTRPALGNWSPTPSNWRQGVKGLGQSVPPFSLEFLNPHGAIGRFPSGNTGSRAPGPFSTNPIGATQRVPSKGAGRPPGSNPGGPRAGGFGSGRQQFAKGFKDPGKVPSPSRRKEPGKRNSPPLGPKNLGGPWLFLRPRALSLGGLMARTPGPHFWGRRFPGGPGGKGSQGIIPPLDPQTNPRQQVPRVSTGHWKFPFPGLGPHVFFPPVWGNHLGGLYTGKKLLPGGGKFGAKPVGKNLLPEGEIWRFSLIREKSVKGNFFIFPGKLLKEFKGGGKKCPGGVIKAPWGEFTKKGGGGGEHTTGGSKFLGARGSFGGETKTRGVFFGGGQKTPPRGRRGTP